MSHAIVCDSIKANKTVRVSYLHYLLIFIAGVLIPLGFAPFHFPGLAILGLAFFFSSILNRSIKQSMLLGLWFGIGYFGVGVSWIIISIHDYGHIHYLIAACITFAFILYLALYPSLIALGFKLLRCEHSTWLSMGSFSVLWCLGEWVRSWLMTGFPWLLIGTSQMDTPMRSLAPIIGVYGLSLLSVFAATLLVYAFKTRTVQRYVYLTIMVLMLISPSLLNSIRWTQIDKTPISVAGIQADLSMRDKWDETLFWDMLKFYEGAIDKLLGQQLIILPESAIPVPERYLTNYLERLNKKAIKANSALIIGILQPVSSDDETHFYNTIMTLGKSSGEHAKRQLVPFGEYIPAPFVAINEMLGLPQPNMLPGIIEQSPIRIFDHPIASLICYEIAYPHLLKAQMPEALWIVSLSDNGWFGRSLASFQQLQMSQMLSLMTGRYQVVVNNNGLSSIINDQGEVLETLPAFSAGILKGKVYTASGTTPWIHWGEYPALVFCAIFLIFTLFLTLWRARQQ